MYKVEGESFLEDSSSETTGKKKCKNKLKQTLPGMLLEKFKSSHDL